MEGVFHQTLGTEVASLNYIARPLQTVKQDTSILNEIKNGVKS